jgi:hypothetical protein
MTENATAEATAPEEKPGGTSKRAIWPAKVHLLIGAGIIVPIVLLFFSPILFDRPWGIEAALWHLIGDTEFSKGYSERAFHKLTIEMSAEDVQALLGEPIRKYRDTDDRWIFEDAKLGSLEFRFHYQGFDDQVCYMFPFHRANPSKFRGKRQSELLAMLGQPTKRIENKWTEETWTYTYSPGDTHFFRRYVTFDRNGKIISFTFDCWFD